MCTTFKNFLFLRTIVLLSSLIFKPIQTSNSTVPSFMAAWSPATNTSYSTSLLEVEKPSLSKHSSFIPSKDSNTIPILAPRAIDAPSTYTFHGQTKTWQTLSVSPTEGVNFAIKSVGTYPLIVFLGLYQTSKDPILVPHLAILPVKSDLLNKVCRGCSVKTYTV